MNIDYYSCQVKPLFSLMHSNHIYLIRITSYIQTIQISLHFQYGQTLPKVLK